MASDKTVDGYLLIAKDNPYDTGTTKQVCTLAISIYDASVEFDKAVFNLYREKTKIQPKIFSKLKVIGERLSQLNKKDRRDVIDRLPQSYSTIQVIMGLKPESVLAGVKSGDITKDLSIRKAKDYVAKVKFPAKYALDGEKGRWGYKQETLFHVVRQEDLNLNDELRKDLKEDLRIICSKYGVQIQDANATSINTLRKEERIDRGLFWKMILGKELDQKWFKTTSEEVRKQFNIKTVQELIDAPIRTFTGFIIKSCGSKEIFWEKFGQSYVAKLHVLSETDDNNAKRWSYKKRLMDVFADPRGRNLAIWNTMILKNGGYV